MKKLLIPLSFIFVILLYGSCSLFKHTSKKTTDDDIKTKTDVEVKKETTEVKVKERKAVFENSNTVATEEITYRKSAEPIELTATFKIDTSSMLSGDTALKLVDVHNSEISVAIYQNKRTNEIMAKVKTGKKTTSVPFDELQIKRTYSNTSNKVDTSKRDSLSANLKVDSADKSKHKGSNSTVDKEAKPSAWGSFTIIGIVLVVVGALLIMYFTRRK